VVSELETQHTEMSMVAQELEQQANLKDGMYMPVYILYLYNVTS
jgi:hypothetical protein